MRSSSGCGTDDYGPTSATSRPSTMPSPPSTRPSDATARRLSAFVHKESETAAAPVTTYGPSSSCSARARFRWATPERASAEPLRQLDDDPRGAADETELVDVLVVLHLA